MHERIKGIRGVGYLYTCKTGLGVTNRNEKPVLEDFSVFWIAFVIVAVTLAIVVTITRSNERLRAEYRFTCL